MADKNNIPQFTGATYQGWAFKVRFGLIEKELHRYVVDFKGRTRIPRPAVIEPLTQAAVDSLPGDAAPRRAAANTHQQNVDARNLLVDAWDAQDLKAQAYIVRFLGPSEQIHVRDCDYAYEMWNNLASFYEVQGAIEEANALAKVSATVMGEAEDLQEFVKRLQVIHGELAHLGKPVSEADEAANLINCLSSRYDSMVEVVQSWEV